MRRPLELSVVVAADTYSTIRRVVECLCAQEGAETIELVVAAPEPAAMDVPDEARRRLGAVQVVEGRLEALPEARSRAIQAATAPVVVFGETHSFPEPGWARALIEAHRGPWTAVGPAILNANPESRVAWSNLLLDYGPWVDRSEAGPVADLMGHNSAYKRDALLAYGARLDELLVSDVELNADLRRHGHAMYFEPAARTRHLNVSRLGPWLAERFDAGRAYAAARARAWPWRRRLLYVAGSPLIPAVRVTRVLRELRRKGRPAAFLASILPALAVGAAVSAAGELCGYAAGASERGRVRLYEKEVHRARFVAGRQARAGGKGGR